MQEGVGNQWMTIASFYLGKVGGPFRFYCNYDINLLNLNTVPAFYIDVLKSWADAQGARERDDDRANPGNIILWNNKNITIAGKSIYWKDWNAAGIERICDLLNENSKLLSYEDFCRKTGLRPPFTNFYGLITAIPDKWKRAALKLDSNFSEQKLKRTAENSCKSIPKRLTERKFQELKLVLGYAD